MSNFLQRMIDRNKKELDAAGDVLEALGEIALGHPAMEAVREAVDAVASTKAKIEKAIEQTKDIQVSDTFDPKQIAGQFILSALPSIVAKLEEALRKEIVEQFDLTPPAPLSFVSSNTLVPELPIDPGSGGIGAETLTLNEAIALALDAPQTPIASEGDKPFDGALPDPTTVNV
jgi:hypothetical protein